jgi:acyl transferase domain-containing protein/thioesterase domain-containing protein/NADPH-dependent curcumin reductase CurA
MADTLTGNDIAVIGAAGRFPGARDLAQFWHNLRNGVESVKFFKDEELLAAGESPELLQSPEYVKAQPVLDDHDRFDAAFFGFSPLDASVMDPQHRLFLEVGWEALEDAAHEPGAFQGNIGVFATCGMNTYMMYNLVRNRRVMDTVGEWLVRHTGNDMNFLATRLSYQLNLQGPSMNVQTACSSALVAVHLACQSLLSGECDMALAGGSTVVLPQGRGYLARQGEILSPDGHCRPFDARARGTLFGSGAGVVVLRRRADAEANGDRILALVKGSAINNDGFGKVGYLAPSVDGQAKAVTEALAISGVDPETISCVEAHGTGTIVGDPIEVTAITQAYRRFTQKTGFCALGSLKGNIGHLGEAAGIAAFIKTVLALTHREIPPSLHYENPNPQIDFASSPFYVNAKLAPWQTNSTPRRAGITSLGAGGTNCHVIVEEAPAAPPPQSSRPWQLLLLSAATPTALDKATQNLGTHVEQHPDLELADVSWSLHVGRKPLAHRRALVCRDRQEAIAACASAADGSKAADRTVAFLFPGQGAQYPNMGRGLYDSEPLFRTEVDQCLAILKRERNLDLRSVLFPTGSVEDASRQLRQTALAQPALFVIEYALARLWMSWGVMPAAMLGHSLGEYVAACLAGVFSLTDALILMADRGKLMQQAPTGVMLAVALPAAEVQELLAKSGKGSSLSVSVVNGPQQTVVGGPDDAIAALEAELATRGAFCRRLETSHAFHSAMMDSILAPFAERVRRVRLSPPTIPYLANLTGTWIRPEEATSVDYWVQHLRSTVRFSDCLAVLKSKAEQVFLEVGPGSTLGGLARQQPGEPPAVVHSLGRPDPATPENAMLLRACGQLWSLGCQLDLAHCFDDQRRRVALPTYPFERQRFWVDPDPVTTAEPAAKPVEVKGDRKTDIADWFYLPTWKRVPPPPPAASSDAPDWLVFLDDCGLGANLVEQLRQPAPATSSPAPVHLEIGEPGDMDSLRLVPEERRQPGPGEVEIRVQATALNFADVLKASGVFPEAPFGMECAGIIERVGPGVEDLRPGDEVVAIGQESFRSYLVRDARLVTRKPSFLSMEEATTLPAVFMTAWYSLHHVAKLRRGEKVLIHAASGGVGLAAVQVARLAGAEIFATAGSPEKRAHLASLGIRHVFDSRSPGFAQEIKQRTRGAGVDVVLNSLTGEFIPASFSVLAAGGRFLELGKREIYTAEQLAALRLQPRVSYSPINLTQMLADDPEAYGRLLREVIDLCNQRRFEALPRHVFPFSDAPSAFRLMLQTRHIGKVVLTLAPVPPGVYTVRAGSKFQHRSQREFVMQPGNAGHYASLLEALEGASAKIGHIAHLWNVTDGRGDRGPIEKRLDRGFFSLTWLAKAMGTRDWAHRVDLNVVSTGLHLVGGETTCQPVKATLLGPCQVIPHEFTNLTCRSVDIPVTAAASWQRERLVGQLAAELRGDPQERVVAYRHSDRLARRCEPTRLQPAGGNVPLRRGGVYLITGGLGGLGLEVAEYLARTTAANLVLIGRTRLPARGDWEQTLQSQGEAGPAREIIRRLLHIEAFGATVLPFAADVTDLARMRAVVAEARKRFGAIHGVIHAAGTLDDGLIQLKTAESALGVLGPKLKGTLVLDEALGGAPLDFFVLFSSISSVLGLQGQVDYTAANIFLDAFAASRSARCAGHTVAINWSAWREVGMAARTIPQGRCPRSHPGQQRPHHPWLESRQDKDSDIVFVTAFSRARHWLLDEHAQHGGDAVLPGTGYLELARGALREIADTRTVEISQVVFQAPFVVAKEETAELSFTLHPAGSGWDFSITSHAGQVTHVTGRLAALAPTAPTRIDLDAIAARCPTLAEAPGGFLKQSFMDFGPRWGNVRELRFGQGEALLSLELPGAFAADLGSFELHPALLDMATGGAQPLIPGFDPAVDFYVPFSYGRVVLHTGLPRRLRSHVRLRDGNSQGVAVFDVTLTDEQGAVVADITDFVMRKVSRLTADAARPAGASALSPAATLAGRILRDGIGPREGIEAFERILACGIAPQIIVSPVDPNRWLAEADAPPAEPRAAGGKVPSPSRNGTHSGDTIERRLMAMYAQILGVQKVGPRDDFFALGGHSLLAVRLLTRIEKEFKQAIPLAQLFRGPTIEHLAKALRPSDEPKRKELEIIVPFNEQGEGPPLYMVHSVGGEVASFRHLARLLGPDQRFYGIQAPPEVLHPSFDLSIESIARHYVDALMAFQPEGPCMLGGWSAGSTLALEMAQQLTARGRHVELVVALDGAPFNTGAGTSLWNPLYYWKLLCNLPYWVADDLIPEFSLPALLRRVRSKIVALTRVAAKSVRRKTWAPTEVNGFMDTTHYSPNQMVFMNALYSALCRYVSRPYAGRILLYKSRTEPLYHLFEVERAWGAVAAEVDLVTVRGTHISLVKEPYVGPIAADLRERLSRMRTRNKSHSDEAAPPAAVLQANLR